MIELTREDVTHIRTWYLIPLMLGLVHTVLMVYWVLGIATYRTTRRFS